MSDNIKVVVKVRPLISREIEEKLSYQWRVKNNTLYQLDQNGKELSQAFTFDKVYDKGTKTRDVYNDIAKPIVEAATAGFNGTIFAYGQTSSGKTYTMTGTDDSPGIIPLAVLNLFEIIKNAPDRDFLLRVSYLEIYNETVKDLLNPAKDNVKIHETLEGIKVDVTEEVTSTPEEVLEAMKKGEANRQKGATNMNESSSRSHSIFQITIESREHIEGSEEAGCVNVSQLNLVDLAGSERAGQTGATGMRFKEGTHINKSLSSLALVIKQLSEDNKFANYRDSKLTRILQNSLGGNAKTSIICAVTPAAVEETISTLQFANRAKAIKNKPEVNAVATDATMIQSLTKQMSRLQSQLESKKSIEQDYIKLQKQIASLQKYIINGFGQRRNLDIIAGSRRKLQQPRRITISAFHTTERDDEHVAPVPKFCTPSLKYNPNVIPKPAEFAPLASASQLPSVPEEPARLVTPPPHRRVCFNDEIIQIDSDDDSAQEDGEGPCSPYHTCQDASKTPPCVLRKNAKLAEKQMKDILLLTEREKIYKPSEIELIEKLEHSISVKSKLEDQVDMLKQQGQEKDLELEQLKNNIKKTEEEVKALTSANMELKTRCTNYDTKLTDWEVSFETLKRKAKLREDELLSLLEELRVKKVESIGSQLSRTIDKDTPFMDMSKDISLVNSDNESSIVNDEPSEQMCDLVTDTQTQSSLKNQTIIDLEAKLFSHKQEIASLENVSQDLQDKITGFKEKLTLMENENSVLKSTIDNLNTTIHSQKENLESSRNDIESYNSVIQELQIKLTQKETTPNININDSVLESMIANEEKFLANNENMKNIIQSLRNVLDNRNKEISQLKLTLISNNSNDDKTLLEEVETKTKQIDNLHLEVDNLKKQVNENIAMINKLMHEGNDLKVLEQELTTKLADTERNNTNLEQNNLEYAISIQNLKLENEKLSRELADNIEKQLEVNNINKDLTEKNDKLSNKIIDLEKDVHDKDVFISSLSEEDKQSNENIQTAKTVIRKLQAILSVLTGEIQEVPELIDNFVNIFSIFSENLNTLEAIATNIVQQKKEAIENNTSLKDTLEKLLEKHKSEISEFQYQIDELNETKNDYGRDNEMLSQQINKLKEELERSNNELQTKLIENDTLKTELNETIRRTETLSQDLISIQHTIVNLNTREEELKAALESKQSSLDEELRNKDDAITVLSLRLKEIDCILKDKSHELLVTATKLNDVQKGRDELLTNILKKALDLMDNCNIENKSCEFENNDVNIYERILLILDKLANHVTFINMKNVDSEQENIKDILSEAKREIQHLTERNVTLTNDLFHLGDKNSELSFELDKIQSNHKNLNEHLESSQEILQSVKRELKMKADELLSMEEKVKEWKDQFVTLDVLMKQQMHELHLENEYLKSQCSRSDLKKDSDVSRVDSEETEILDDYSNEFQNTIPLSNANKSSEIISPPSLLTICCNKIVDSINSNSDIKTSANSDTVIEVNNDDTGISCRCSHLSLELEISKEENARIMAALEESEIMNKHLIKEQEDARQEILHLVELEQELQKKLLNHRTNLSILTATTYAENKSLKSQVKVLQHHHSRFHNVCQRDIPDFKKQLRDLMLLLNGETSNTDSQNISSKRYSLPDVLDSSTVVPNFRNESTLDGDLLMLDTNVTLTTAADNTLLGPDQTCLDLTQTFYNEACVQTNDLMQSDQNINSQMEILSHDNQAMFEKLELMRDENLKLREQLDKYLGTKGSMIDAQSSPIKTPPNLLNDSVSNCDNIISPINDCSDCRNRRESQSLMNIEDELKSLSQELLEVKSQKAQLELKYNNLILETPSTDALVRKLNNLEKDHTNKALEIAKLNKTIDSKNRELKRLQDENDNLSTQVMDNITESDDLYKELESLKHKNTELTENFIRLEKSTKEPNASDKTDNVICTECMSKDELIQSMRLKITKTKLNRSFSDSDSSSRYNTICTLQSELHAGREDCKELTEDVVTIKNHLDRSNLSMDLDESMGDSNVFSLANDFLPASPQSKKCNMPDIPEERHLDMYMMDKIDCYNYCTEKTGIGMETLNSDMKIIEVLKMLYENVSVKHGREVEHLTNKLKEYSDAKVQLQKQIDDVKQEYSKFTKEIQEKDKHYSSIANVLTHIKNSINAINHELINASDADKNTQLVNIYKENFLKLLDKEFGLSSVGIFEFLIHNIVNKHQADLAGIMDQYTKLQNHMENVTKELSSVNDNLSQMKCQLSDKENECNLLKARKERIHEICNAVTLDIVKREKELNDTMTKGYQRLLELNIPTASNVDLTLPLNVNINLLFEQLITQNESRESAIIVKEKECLETELNTLKSSIENKEKELALIKTENHNLIGINNNINLDLNDKENKIQTLKNLHDELNQVYESKVDENKNNINLIEKMTEEISMLKSTIIEKQKGIETLERELNALTLKKVRDDAIMELRETIKDENENLKAVNEMVVKENEEYASELKKSGETIRQNNIELDKMTSDILVLRESVKDNLTVIENLKIEAETLVKDNIELKEKLEAKGRECSRLDTNIKTHEKTAQIQTRIINRLEKQKIEDDKAVIEKNKQLEELSQKYDELQNSIKICNDENEELKKTKESLEARISDLETALANHKPRSSMDAIADSSRRRRQSMHDSKRLYAEGKHDGDDHSHAEAVFGTCSKPDDFFMDVDDTFSDRSTPIRLSKGQESLSISRADQSEKEEEHGSRPSSVAAARRRRQSSHDLHRAVPAHTPDLHDFHPGILMEELNNLKTSHRSTSHSEDGEASEVQRRLAACRQELEELKEKYRELDEECETCAEYLRERDQQCARYKKDNTALQLTITELKEKLQSCSPNLGQQVGSKCSVAHAAVNTDEDWANLHAVVVDRMSYDAEVEKNKKLTKTIEELRFKKQDLKNTLAKMQRALEKNSGNRELETTKQELEACKEELQELQDRYKELDEECETCAQYLREKEEQCRKLKEAKMSLEAKLQEFQEDVSNITHTARKKRQTAHDQNRAAALDVADATTETADFLSYQVERDDSTRMLDDKHAKETKRLKMVVEKLSQQKATLEQQLVSAKQAPTPMYVATGSAIVQNQQITDVMKENQKLKKINAKLINICKKRGKDSNRENEDPGIKG